MSESAHLAYNAIVHGRVQGVGFRYTAMRKALKLGLTGWVRNCGDGTVETHFEGSPERAGEFISWLRQGPPGARVTRVDKQAVPPTGTYRTFTLEY